MTTQAKKLRDAREALGFTTEELARELGKSVKTVRAWLLSPDTNRAYRKMPKSAVLLLERILADRKRK